VLRGGNFLLNGNWEAQSRGNSLVVCCLDVSSNGTEIAAGCSDGSIRIYGVGGASGGKLMFVCDTKTAQVEDSGISEAGDENMKKPPTDVCAVSWGGVGNVSSNDDWLVFQTASGLAGGLHRSMCFKGGYVLSENWTESNWNYNFPNYKVKDMPNPVALLCTDGVDSFSIVNECEGDKRGSGNASAGASEGSSKKKKKKNKHILVRRKLLNPTKEMRLSMLSKGKSCQWVDVGGGGGGGGGGGFGAFVVADIGNLDLSNGYDQVIKMKCDGIVVGAEIHPSKQYVVILSR